MLLARYLEARRSAVGESINAFARRAGVPQQTLHEILRGSGCNVSTAYLIISASKAEPAPGKRICWVTFEDLVPEKTRTAAVRLRREHRAAIVKAARAALRDVNRSVRQERRRQSG